MNNVIDDLDFYGKFASMKSSDVSDFKNKYLFNKTQGYIYKFVSLSEIDISLNLKKIVSLGKEELWFGCPWTMNDPTEFFVPHNLSDFSSFDERGLFDYHMSIFYEMYNLCSFSQNCGKYMWDEYGNHGNGFCLCFKVKDFDWFYPIEYVENKDNYSYVDLWRADIAKKNVKGKLDNAPLAYLPYVIKDRINKSTGKNSKREEEIRAIYCTYNEDNENNGILLPGYKKENNIRGNSVPWNVLNISLHEIIVGDICAIEYKTKIAEIAKNMKVKYKVKKIL